jgi:exodeoxyribonuclease III
MSWNVNGLRAAARHGFVDKLRDARADVFGVQEVRAETDSIPEGVRTPRGFTSHFVAAARKGYSGVGLYARQPFDAVQTTLGVRRFDIEGRLQLARFGRLVIANVYFPNGNGKERDNSRVPYKLAFYRRLFEELGRWRRAGHRVIVMGDFNTAHREIDLARPKQNTKTSGFLPEERAEIDRWIHAGWVDTFRAFQSEGGHYTWWSQRLGVRAKNIGWRIDYVLATPAAMRYVTDAFIRPELEGSDHCPVGVDLDPAVMR